jgi:prepilin-type N-terminal cleavage/methylation domain-containing protein
MRLSQRVRTGGRGFTLVELLVVIAIIAILVSLISAAVVKALAKGNETANVVEIRKLSDAVQAFKAEYKVDYLPSRIKLANSLAGYPQATTPNTLDFDSIQFLQSMFPRLDWSSTSPPINWGGQNGATLEGDQCLVFFLGGIQRAPGGVPDCSGFSTNPRNPTAPTLERKPVFYEFKSSRLVSRPNGYFVYLDVYAQQPYAYFSSYKSRNGYNRYFGQFMDSDCRTIGVWPYAASFSPASYMNPDTWQIISAGADGNWSRGSVPPTAGPFWNPKNPGSFSGSDDQCNFHDVLLGIAAE